MKPNIREMSLVDIPYVMPMYENAVREERGQPGVPQYPAVPETADVAHEFGRLLVASLGTPGFGAFVAAPVGRKPKGYILGRVYTRLLGTPPRFLNAEMLYIDPPFRHRQLGVALGDALWTWGQQQGCGAVEASYIPGSHGERIWAGAGFRPYRVCAVFVDATWQPRQDMVRPPPVVTSLHLVERA